MDNEKKQLRSKQEYHRFLKDLIPPKCFEPTPGYLILGLIFLCLQLTSIYLIVEGYYSFYFNLILSVLLGNINATLAFLIHEILHGNVIKKKRLQDSISVFLNIFFLTSPTYWRYRHNYLHHTFTQKPLIDPDAFPKLKIYKLSPFIQKLFLHTPGSGTIRSFFYLFYNYAYQSFLSQTYRRFSIKAYDKMDHSKVSLEFYTQALLVVAVMAYSGVYSVFTVIIPILIQNYIVLSYIATNHSMCAQTPINDPLINTLSVTNNPILEFLHLNFGYHVEHHLFPNVSSWYYKKISKILRNQFPDRYKEMSKMKAIKKLYQLPKIYKNSKTLIHPISNETYPVI